MRNRSGLTARRTQWWLAPLALASTACQDDGDARHMVDIGEVAVVSSDEPLCGGDILRIEQAIAHAEEILDVTVDEPIPVAVYNHFADYEQNIAGRCRSGSTGCFVDGEVHTMWQSLEHELVHAVARPAGFPDVFWDEGIAEALSNRTERGTTSVESNLDLPAGDLPEYRTAGHFVRWLLEEYGASGIQRILREEEFSVVYGFELADAATRYEAEGPWSYPHWNPCQGEPISATGPDAWVVDVEIDCAAPSSTVRYSRGVGAVRTIDIERSGTYRVRLNGGSGLSIVACQIDVLDVAPEGDFAGDIIREEAGLKPPTGFVSEQEHEVVLEPGRLLIYVSTEDGVTEGRLGLEFERLGE